MQDRLLPTETNSSGCRVCLESETEGADNPPEYLRVWYLHSALYNFDFRQKFLSDLKGQYYVKLTF